MSANVMWTMAPAGVSLPLVLPRGRNESPQTFVERLDVACTVPESSLYCPVILAQGATEDDEAAATRLRLQSANDETIVPFSEKFETLEEFEERLS